MSRVFIREAGIRRFFSDPNSPVAKIIDRYAQEIKLQALANIMVTFNPRSGDLEGALRTVPFIGRDGFYHVAVGTDATHRNFPYARALETGINPLTGEPMSFGAKPYMVPAVEAVGFSRRS